MTDKKSLLHNKGLLAGVAVVALVGVGAAAWSMGAFNGSGGGGMATEIDLGLMPVSYGENCGFVDEDGKIAKAWPKISPKDSPTKLLDALAADAAWKRDYSDELAEVWSRKQ